MAGMVENRHEVQAAFEAGRRSGFAVSALALSLVAFLSLLGIEKAMLAAALASLALRGSRGSRATRRLGMAALIASCVYAVTYVVVLVLFWDKLGALIAALKELS